MNYHPTVYKILEILTANNLWHETFEHEPVRTSEEASRIRPGYNMKQGAKALIVRVVKSPNNEKFIMIVVPGDMRFDNKKAKSYLDAKDIRFASEEEVSKLTEGVIVGGVPPFGNLFGLDVFVDSYVFNNERIIFNAGDRRFSVAMRSEDYKKVVPLTVCDLV